MSLTLTDEMARPPTMNDDSCDLQSPAEYAAQHAPVGKLRLKNTVMRVRLATDKGTPRYAANIVQAAGSVRRARSHRRS